MNRNTTLIRRLCLLAFITPLIALGQTAPKPNRIVINPNGLPKPFETKSVQNQPRVVPQPDGARLQLPQGFDLSVFSEGDYKQPRWVYEGPNGDLFLTDSDPLTSAIYRLRDLNKDGKIDNATERFTFVN